MIHIENWDAIQEAGEFETPIPGAYIAVIRRVEDREDKEYLEIFWDFAEGAYFGENQAAFDRAGFWPIVLRRSYKEKALGFFKAFKTAVEQSNAKYIFDDRNVQGLVGKRMGVVLGKEEYRKKNGDIGERLYVFQTRSIQAIQDGDFIVPELKVLKERSPVPAPNQFSTFSQPSGFQPYSNDEDLPF